MVVCTNCGERNPEHARFCLACGSTLPAHPSSGARRVVTVLFCDLVGSTEMVTRLDPESMRSILDRYFEMLTTIVAAHGGRVEKFIGDAVLAVFGLPRVHEDDPLRAARAAVAIRDAMSELSKELERESGVSLHARIGVHTGEVVTGDPEAEAISITGGAVNLAARLEQVAEPGEIVLGADTYRSVQDAVAAEEMTPVTLKGFAEPVAAFRLLGVVPGALGHARRFDPPIVDRDAERELLRQALNRVVTGHRCQLFTILGAPGIGKSRVVEEFVRERSTGELVLAGRCLPYGDGITFYPISQMVRRAAGMTDEDDPETALAKIQARVAGIDRDDVVARRVGQALGLAQGTPSPDEIFWAMRRFFEAVSRSQPLVLVFDDVHWAEPTLLDLIEHIADRSRDAAMMLICMARRELLDVRATWGAGAFNATTILLEPLAPADSDTMIGNLLAPAELEPAVRERIGEVAAAYPLFVEEIVRHLTDTGALVRDGDRWVAASDLSDLATPPSITALLSARLDRLEPAERDIVERASVIGKDFFGAEVDAISPAGTTDEVPRLLASAVNKDLVRRRNATGDDGYSFPHMLLRDVAYDGIRKSTRAELHERYASWLEERAGLRTEPYEEIVAYHLEQAFRYRGELGPVDEAVERLAVRAGIHAAAAGRRAVARGDISASVKLLEKAAALLPSNDPDRLTMLPHLADSLFQAGEQDRAESVYDEMLESAHRTDDPALEARARMDRYTWQLVTDPGSTSGVGLQHVVEDALKEFEGADNAEHLAAGLEALGIMHRLVTGDSMAMLDAGERGLELGDPASPAAATSADIVAQALFVGSTPCDVALGRLETLLGDFTNEPMVRAGIELRAALVLAMLDRSVEARERAAASSDMFDELSQPRWSAEAANVTGLIDWWDGDVAAAERSMHTAYRSFEQRGEADAALLAGDLALILFDLGRDDEAHALIPSIIKDAPSFALEQQIGWNRAMARTSAVQGDRSRAEEFAREAVRLASSTDFLALQSDTLVDLADVLLRDRPGDAIQAADAAIHLCVRKGSVVGARRARTVRERANAGYDASP
jgi:class 3 adenylate cyclase/tetratricopeptide (TPR) repeat protein